MKWHVMDFQSMATNFMVQKSPQDQRLGLTYEPSNWILKIARTDLLLIYRMSCEFQD
jgi:hypothetical protein